MFHKIIASGLMFGLVISTFAQEMPGKPMPVASESSDASVPFLNSAPADPGAFLTISDIVISTTQDEAVLTFTTEVSTHVTIEYGFTPDYERSISTESQTQHTETLGELTPCTKYYYAVRAGDVSREGTFETQCPIVKKTVKKAVTKKVTPPAARPPVTTALPEETIPVLNAAPEKKPELEQKIEAGNIRSEAQIDEATPETPALPGPIAFGDDTMSTPDTTDTEGMPVALLIFAFLSGLIVMVATFHKKKKWYQK